MPPLLLALAACAPTSDPEEVALQACEAMPGLHVDAAGQQLARGAVLDEEIDIWHDDLAYGPGIGAVGLSGYGVIRANSRCTLEAVTSDAASLTRAEPDLDRFEAVEDFERTEVMGLPKVDRAMTFTLVETPEGPRVALGLAALRAEAEAARQLALAGDIEGAMGAYDALEARLPDPMLRWHRVAARSLHRERAALAALELELLEGILWAVNRSEAAVPEGSLTLICGGRELSHGRPELAPEGRVGLSLEGVEDLEACRLVLTEDR